MKVKKWLLGLVTFAAMAVICAVCAVAEMYGEDLFYKVLDDGTVEIARYYGSAEKVDIPAEIDGKSVTRIGANAFEYCSNITSITIPDSVTSIYSYAFRYCTSLKSITIPDGVTEICNYTFEHCTSLKSVTIPGSVTSIDGCAFRGCESLKSITIPDSVKEIGGGAFSGCESLKSITIPDSVKEIGSGAFSGCESLISVTIPKSVTKISYNVFNGCTSLTAINVATENQNYVPVNGVLYNKDKTVLICYPAGKKDKNYKIPDGVTSIGRRAFEGCTNLKSITIPNSITRIGDSAFEGCASLTSITIPNSVTYISDDAFSGCTSLKSVAIPNSITSIGDSAFGGCTNLSSITIPSSVTSIGDSAFGGCANLSSITIPSSVTSIGNWAFEDCTSLASVTIPSSVAETGYCAFSGCTSLTAINVATGNQNYVSVNGVLYNKDKTTIMRYPAGKKDKSYKIPDSVTSIDGGAFRSCASLTSITIPDGVTSIGSRAFEGCSSLASITIPDSVTDIDDCTFRSCASLTNITIPDGVRSLGNWTFEDCKSLTGITIPNSVDGIYVGVFNGCSSLTSITIPDSVRMITGEAFEGCTSLTTINVATGNQNYVSVNGVLYNKDKTDIICYPAGKKDKNYEILDGVTWIGSSAFSGCTSLTSITIPNSVTFIPDDAFSGCTSLSSITIPDGVTSIGNLAFKDCTSLASITIPSSVTETGYCAFRGCTSLTAINVATGNQKYASVNGVLYNKDKTAIICYPAGKKDKNYNMPDSVTSMGVYAFSGCTNLTNITIPDSVTGIGDSAFSGCTSLTGITIPDSVEFIGYEVFLDCMNFTSITIPSSVARIRNHAFGYYNDNGYKKIDNFKIYCYSGTKGEKYAIDNGFDYVLLDKLPTLSKVTGAKLTGRAADALRINWSKNANADGYIVEMYQNGKWERVAKITNSNTTTYRKAGLKAGTVYNFRVKAYKMYGSTAIYSEYSATVTARTNPSVMTGAKLGGRAADELRINWTKNASADGYIVEMYQGNKWVRVAKIINNSTTTFRKAGLKASSVYKFRVRAYKMSGSTALYGNYSVTVTAMTNPSVMAGAKLGGRAADALRINWTKNASADGYIVEMYQGNKWVRVAKITSNSTTTFRKAGLKASSVYKFRVSAYKMSGKTALYGNYSATVTARTNPSIVKGVKIGGKAKDALRVNWAKNASAQGYIVEMYKGGKWVRVAKITNGNTTTYRKAGLAKNTAYKFRVRAYHMSGKTALYGNYGSVSGKTAAK